MPQCYKGVLQVALAMTRPTKHSKTGVYWIRKAVPAALRPIVGKRELVESLGTKDPQKAKLLSRPVIEKFEAILSAARAGQLSAPTHVNSDSPLLARLPAGSAEPEVVAPARQSAPLTAQNAIDRWRLEKRRALTTVKKYRAAFGRLVECIGFDDLTRIKPEDAVRFKEARLEQGRDPGTVQDEILACGTVCNWAVKNKKLAANPFEGIAPDAESRGPAPREAYNDDEARRILAATRDEKGWRRWLPWILAFTGCRISEAAQLRLRDVRQEACRQHEDQEELVWVFDFVPLEVREGKNNSFQRMVPIHPAIIDEGFLDFVRAKHGGPDDPLFDDLAEAADGTRTTTAQTQHGRWLRAVVGIRDPRKGPAHSWRHRMQDELRKVRAHPEIIDAITGRKNPRNAGDGYGRGFRGMPEETLKDLRRIPSPLAVPNRASLGTTRSEPVEPYQSNTLLELEAAMRSWFSSKVKDAYSLYADPAYASALMPPDATGAELARNHAAVTVAEAESRIEQLKTDYRNGDLALGRNAAREVLRHVSNKPIPERSQAFDVVAVWASLALGEIEEARCRWAEGDRLYCPTMPELAGLLERIRPGGDLYVALSGIPT